MVRVVEDHQRVTDDLFAALIHVADQIARQANADTLDEPSGPGGVVHVLAVRTEPGNIGNALPANAPALKELPPLEDRVTSPGLRCPADEIQELLAAVIEVPVEPGEFIVLAIGVVVTFLRMAQLVAGEKHRNTLREKQRREEIPLLPLAQGEDICVVGRSLGTAVPGVVVVGPVFVVLPIGFIVLVVVADEILEREAIMAGDEVDAGMWGPAALGI